VVSEEFQDAAQYGPPPVGKQMKLRNVFAVWIGLPLITLGIYHLVWYYKIHEEMKEFDPRETQINPVGSLLTIMFGWILCGIPPYVSYYNTGKRIANAQRAAGLPQTCNPVVGLLLMFVFSLGTLYYQGELNKINEHYGSVPEGSPVQLAG
jgi:sulfite exporter TauE/SafE